MMNSMSKEHEHAFEFDHWINHPTEGLQIAEKCSCGETRTTIDEDDDPVSIFLKMSQRKITAKDFYDLMTRVTRIEKQLNISSEATGA